MSEKPGVREAMAEMVGKLRKGGASQDYAERKARECAVRFDRRVDEGRTKLHRR